MRNTEYFNAEIELRAAEIAADHERSNGLARIMSAREGLGWAAHANGVAADEDDAQELVGWLARQIVDHENCHEQLTYNESAPRWSSDPTTAETIAALDADHCAPERAMRLALGDERYEIAADLAATRRQVPSLVIARAVDELLVRAGWGSQVERLSRRRRTS